MKYKNYYKILELNNDKVSGDEIKEAFRKLAKKYHPDINPGNERAIEKFKDINEAYQMLSNEESKRKYDMIHLAHKITDGAIFSEAIKSFNAKGGASELFSMFFGKLEKDSITQDKGLSINGDDLESEIEATLEEAFFGAEKKLAYRTIDDKIKTITVKIPKGIHGGEKIRLAGQGKSGKNGGKNGDFYIKVNILEHKKFKLDGSNLVLDLPLTPWEAALGCKLEIQNIDSNILVTVPEGTQSGEKLRIANSGYTDKSGGRGDLLLETRILVPKAVSDEERQLFEKFGQISKFSPRNN